MSPSAPSGVLVVLSGLPGVGKTTVARRVSDLLGGVHLRLDTIEAAMVDSGIVAAAGGWDAHPGAGYRVAYGVATDLLRAGHVVIADSVNPLRITRESWVRVTVDVGARVLNVELVCSDVEVHRRRVEARTSDLPGLTVPTWAQVQARDHQPWDEPVLPVDTAAGTDRAADQVVAEVRARCLPRVGGEA